LLNRFYDIQKGSIKIDNKPLTTYSLNSLRSQIGFVLQDVFLFNGSILENIQLGNTNITEAEVIAAAKEVGVHDFICKLPGAYHFNVNERGSTLSVGQRQLISFVRVLLQNPKILVLDEATSSIDSENESLIQEAMKKLLVNRTSILIAHRLSTVQNADTIMVLDKGKIVEMGSPNELYELNGQYRKLFDAQFS
jgi:ATP-binding cassette, subfamily B, multidrug efflux pump